VIPLLAEATGQLEPSGAFSASGAMGRCEAPGTCGFTASSTARRGSQPFRPSEAVSHENAVGGGLLLRLPVRHQGLHPHGGAWDCVFRGSGGTGRRGRQSGLNRAIQCSEKGCREAAPRPHEVAVRRKQGAAATTSQLGPRPPVAAWRQKSSRRRIFAGSSTAAVIRCLDYDWICRQPMEGQAWPAADL